MKLKLALHPKQVQRLQGLLPVVVVMHLGTNEKRRLQDMTDWVQKRLPWWGDKAVRRGALWLLQERNEPIRQRHLCRITPPIPESKKKVKRLLVQASECWDIGLETMPYQQFLTTKYWFLVRRAKMEEAHFKCEDCSRYYGIQVHHLNYRHRGTDHKHTNLLKVLCDRCHKDAHRI